MVTSQPVDVGGLHVELLGSFRVAVGTRIIPDDQWKLRKASTIVKLLGLTSGHCLHREQLIDVLWPGGAPASAAGSLNQTLYVARRTLDPFGGSGHFLTFQKEILHLCPDDPLWIDVESFEAAAARARHTRETAAYRAALDLYRGELLPQDLYEDWINHRRESLRQLHVGLLAELAALHVAKGAHTLAIETLTLLLASDSANEPAHRALMRLYAEIGNRPQALHQYARLGELLRRELDSEPDAESRRLYEQIVAGSVQTVETKAAAPAHNLPFHLTSFIGREREKGEVKRLLAATHLLTLTGTGGCGKTRLALEVAAALLGTFHDGVWCVELAPLSDAALVPRAIATTLGVTEAAGQPMLTTLAAHLRERQLLLVLDNCEHLIEAAARTVDLLLRACPKLRILATSREALRVAGELTWLVPSLSLPDPRHLSPLPDLIRNESVRLFSERAAAVALAFSVTLENASTIAQICFRLDGIPLAIELAAARVNVLAIEEILARLNDRFRLLTIGSRTALGRQQTLRAAIDWSYELLSEPERLLFRRLAVFAGGWTLQAAEIVCAGEGLAGSDILALISRLVAKSLLGVEPGTHENRYQMLETIREYARDRLVEMGEDKLGGERHCSWCINLIEHTYPHFWGEEHVPSVNRLESENDNLRAALGWSIAHDTQAGLRLAASLWQFWILRGFLAEGMQWLETLLAAAPEPTEVRARALISKFGLSWRSGLHLINPEMLSDEAMDIYQRLGDAVGKLQTYQFIGAWKLTTSTKKAKPLFRASLTLARKVGFEAGIACAVNFLGVQAFYVGDYPEARVQLEESLKRFQALDSTPNVSALCLNIQQMPFAYGVHRQWRIVDEENIVLRRQLSAGALVGYTLANLGNLARAERKHTRAQKLLEASLAYFRQISDQAGVGQALGQLGYFFAAIHDYPHAKAAFHESLVRRQEIGDRRGIGRSLSNLGSVYTLAHDYERARVYLTESLELFQEMQDNIGLTQTHNHLGNLALEEGDFNLARSHYKQSRDLMDSISKLLLGPHYLNLAAVSVAIGDRSDARVQLRLARATYRQRGDRRGAEAAGKLLRNLDTTARKGRKPAGAQMAGN